MKDLIKVRIDKADNSWYVHQIGVELFVESFSPVHYVLKEPDGIQDYFIRKDDCTVISTEQEAKAEPKLIAKAGEWVKMFLTL